MTQQERQRRLELERNFRAKRPSMPTGKNVTVNKSKHFGAVYGKSTVPINHPRPKDQPNKVAVKAEGAGSFGYSPRNEDQGYKNGEKGAPCAINRQSVAMEAKIDRWLAQARKERNNRAKPIAVVVGPGREQAILPRKRLNAYEGNTSVLFPSLHDKREKQTIAPLPAPMPHASTWGAFANNTLAAFKKAWR